MNKNPKNASNIEHYSVDDEIDLIKLMQTVWSQKVTVFVVTILSVAIAATYLALAIPYYQVQSVLRPPSVKELEALNQTGIYELSSEQALQRVSAALNSYQLRLNFYLENQELFDIDKEGQESLVQSFESFNKKAFKMLQPNPKKSQGQSSYVGIQLTYPDGVQGVAVVNGLVRAAIDSEREKITSELKERIKNRLKQVELKMIAAREKYEASVEIRIAKLLEADNLKTAKLQDELKSLREKNKFKRLSRVKELDEAIAISKALGIEKPSTPLVLNGADTAVQGNVLRTEMSNSAIPLYFMGTQALEVEREILLKRKTDDFTEPKIAEIEQELLLLQNNREVEVLKRRENDELFIDGKAELREEMVRLQNLQADYSDIDLVTIDRRPVEPLLPVKPKKVMIVVVSVFLGLISGIVVALLIGILKRR